MADDFFGFLDADEPKDYTPPAGYEGVHQAGMSWARQGISYQTTSRISHRQWNHIIAQFRGLGAVPAVDVSDLQTSSPLLLADFIARRILAILDGTDVPGYQLMPKAVYDPDDDGIIALAQLEAAPAARLFLWGNCI